MLWLRSLKSVHLICAIQYGRKEDYSKIDYIFSDMLSISDESYVVEDKPVDGVYLPDHSPVIGFVTVE